MASLYRSHLGTLTVAGGDEPPPLPGAGEVVSALAAVAGRLALQVLDAAVSQEGRPRQVDALVVLWAQGCLALLAGLSWKVSEEERRDNTRT